MPLHSLHMCCVWSVMFVANWWQQRAGEVSSHLIIRGFFPHSLPPSCWNTSVLVYEHRCSCVSTRTLTKIFWIGLFQRGGGRRNSATTASWFCQLAWCQPAPPPDAGPYVVRTGVTRCGDQHQRGAPSVLRQI